MDSRRGYFVNSTNDLLTPVLHGRIDYSNFRIPNRAKLRPPCAHLFHWKLSTLRSFKLYFHHIHRFWLWLQPPRPIILHFHLFFQRKSRQGFSTNCDNHVLWNNVCIINKLLGIWMGRVYYFIYLCWAIFLQSLPLRVLRNDLKQGQNEWNPWQDEATRGGPTSSWGRGGCRTC